MKWERPWNLAGELRLSRVHTYTALIPPTHLTARYTEKMGWLDSSYEQIWGDHTDGNPPAKIGNFWVYIHAGPKKFEPDSGSNINCRGKDRQGSAQSRFPLLKTSVDTCTIIFVPIRSFGEKEKKKKLERSREMQG
jgi:hypothetical protein